MTRIINETQGGYTVVTNNVVRDNRISLKAKGLMVMLMSLPDGWEFSVLGLAAICKEGKDAIRGGVYELERAGYLRRVKHRNDKGQLDGSDWVITNTPSANEPSAGIQSTVMPSQINKEVTSKDELTIPPIVPLATSDEVRMVVDHLNSVTGSSFRANSAQTKRRITARLKEGFTVEDMKAVVDTKSRAWMGDAKMRGYLRPDTLFGSKFEGYLQEARKEVARDADYQPFDDVW